jgi:hypothetical protein
MMNRPLWRLDPLGRSALISSYVSNDDPPLRQTRGSAWPISTGSMRPIVDTRAQARG